MIHLKLIFFQINFFVWHVIRVKICFFPTCLSDYFSSYLLKKISFPPLNCLGANCLVENQLSLYVWAYFWTLFSASNLFICSY